MSKINNSENKSYRDYLNNPSSYAFNFKTINVDTTGNIINCLNPKSSCGKDSTSTKLLKSKNKTIVKRSL